MKILYISEGQLCLLENGKTSVLPSYRIQQYQQTLRQIAESKEWKTTGRGAQFMGVAQAAHEQADEGRASIGGLAPYEDGFLYTLRLDSSGALYRRDLSPEMHPEGHIVSGNDVHLGRIAVSGGKLAAELLHQNGQQHLGIYRLPNTWCTELTDGESRESAPCWSADGRELYFSTCGIARSARGVLYSPVSVMVYRDDTGQAETLLEDPKLNYRSPRPAPDGGLYLIREPYKAPTEDDASLLGALKDVLLFPWRIVQAIFGFLNIFSVMFGGQSLRSNKQHGDVKQKQRSEKEIFFEENLLHATQNQRENELAGDDAPGILPRSRVLIRRAADGTEEVLAHAVLDYCPAKDGTLVYSNGAHILARHPDGTTEDLAKAHMAQCLAVIE